MHVRRAEEGDAAAVTALWTEGYGGRGEGEGRRAPYERSEFLAAAASGELIVAERAGGLLGVVLFRPPGTAAMAIARAGEAELGRLAVAAAARRSGVGRALAELCTERARACGAGAVALWSRPYQVEAHRLYASLGYRRVLGRDGSDAEGRRLAFLLALAA